MKRVLLVNGVPASGKSTVARAIADARAWPLLTLDTVKEAFFDHLGTGDRDYSRLLGKASYQSIFALIKDFPSATTTLVDAWFGFQPIEVLQRHLAGSGIERVVEVWCHAPPAVVGERYRARLAHRHAGHLGEAYAPELIALAERVRPLGIYPLLNVDTAAPIDVPALLAAVDAAFDRQGESNEASPRDASVR